MVKPKRKRKALTAKVPSLTTLTTIQRRMLAVLSDGQAHTKAELHACLWDDKSAFTSIRRHVSAIRQALRPHGHTVVCELVNVRAVRYRWVRLISEAATSAVDATDTVSP